MYQIDVPSAVRARPASTPVGTPGYFTDGDLSGGVAPTVVPAEFLNALMLESLGLITGAGLTPQKAATNQMLQAVQSLAAQAVANYQVPLRPYQDASSAPASTLYVDRAVSQVGGYYQDTGSVANAYVVALIPAVTAYDHVVSFRFRTQRPNTGPATINFGAGPVPLNNEQGFPLAAGDINIGAITAVTYDPAAGFAIVNETVLSQLGQLARENIGQGLEDDGAGNLRVKLADASLRRTTSGIQSVRPVSPSLAVNYTFVPTDNGVTVNVTGPSITLTAPKTSTVWNGYNVTVIAQGGPVSFQPNAADSVNGAAAGTAYSIIQGQTLNLVTDGAGNWWPVFQTTPQGAYSPRFINTSQVIGAGTYAVGTTTGPVTLTLPSGVTVGTIIGVSDPFGTWGTNAVTMARNGATILGQASDLVLDVSGWEGRLIFDGSDWRLF